jgi:hypothetical protein
MTDGSVLSGTMPQQAVPKDTINDGFLGNRQMTEQEVRRVRAGRGAEKFHDPHGVSADNLIE